MNLTFSSQKITVVRSNVCYDLDTLKCTVELMCSCYIFRIKIENLNSLNIYLKKKSIKYYYLLNQSVVL